MVPQRVSNHVAAGKLSEYRWIISHSLAPSRPQLPLAAPVPKEHKKVRYGEVYSLSTSANSTDKEALASTIRGAPNFAAAQRNRLPHAPKAAFGGRGPSPPLPVRRLCFQSKELMMTTYDHINELRAELAATIDQAERQQIAAELATAEAKLAGEEAAFEALISNEPPH